MGIHETIDNEDGIWNVLIQLTSGEKKLSYLSEHVPMDVLPDLLTELKESGYLCQGEETTNPTYTISEEGDAVLNTLAIRKLNYLIFYQQAMNLHRNAPGEGF